MSKKEILESLIKTIQAKELLTDFIKELFDYENFHDYNYLFRITSSNDEVIIDIYDNISNHRFNRYIFSYNKGKYHTKVIEENNVFVTYIDVLNLTDNDNKLYKLAYMTTLDSNKMIDYAKTFLDDRFVNILKEIIK